MRRPAADRLAMAEEFSAFTYEAQAPLRRAVRARVWPIPLRLRDLLSMDRVAGVGEWTQVAERANRRRGRRKPE